MSTETKKAPIKKKDLATIKVYKSFSDAFGNVSKNLESQHIRNMAKVRKGGSR